MSGWVWWVGGVSGLRSDVVVDQVKGPGFTGWVWWVGGVSGLPSGGGGSLEPACMMVLYRALFYVDV